MPSSGPGVSTNRKEAIPAEQEWSPFTRLHQTVPKHFTAPPPNEGSTAWHQTHPSVDSSV